MMHGNIFSLLACALISMINDFNSVRASYGYRFQHQENVIK